MPKTVDVEVFEGLRSLQQKIEEGDKSVAFCLADRDRATEAFDRETARVADLRTKFDAARARLSLPAEALTFDEAAQVILTKTEVDAAQAAAEAAALAAAGK